VLGLHHNFRRWKRRGELRSGTRFRLIGKFTDEHDELWERMASTCTCAVVRDASYLNWKYVDRPSRAFSCIEMRDGDDVTGVLVVMLAEPNDVYRHVRGFLVDFLVPLDRRDLISALIGEGVAVLKKMGAQTIICQSSGPGVCAGLEHFGFFAWEPRHQFLVAPGVGQEAIAHCMLDSENWFLTLGDSDADAYAD